MRAKRVLFLQALTRGNMWYLYEFRGVGKNPRLIEVFNTHQEAVNALYELETLYPLKEEYYIDSELDEDAL
jgi:hypothetical protein